MSAAIAAQRRRTTVGTTRDTELRDQERRVARELASMKIEREMRVREIGGQMVEMPTRADIRNQLRYIHWARKRVFRDEGRRKAAVSGPGKITLFVLRERQKEIAKCFRRKLSPT